MPPERENVIHQLVVGNSAAVAEIVACAHSSDDMTTLVAAALFAPDSTDLLQRAASVATTTRDRKTSNSWRPIESRYAKNGSRSS